MIALRSKPARPHQSACQRKLHRATVSRGPTTAPGRARTALLVGARSSHAHARRRQRQAAREPRCLLALVPLTRARRRPCAHARAPHAALARTSPTAVADREPRTPRWFVFSHGAPTPPTARADSALVRFFHARAHTPPPTARARTDRAPRSLKLPVNCCCSCLSQTSIPDSSGSSCGHASSPPRDITRRHVISPRRTAIADDAQKTRGGGESLSKKNSRFNPRGVVGIESDDV